jgi:hypothetical protein
MQNPSISKKAFWDVKFENLDFEKNSLFIMEKVFNYGSWFDQVQIMKYYGLSRIKNEIIGANYLRNPVLSFLSVLLDIEKKEFKCYMRKQSNPLPWPY